VIQVGLCYIVERLKLILWIEDIVVLGFLFILNLLIPIRKYGGNNPLRFSAATEINNNNKE